MIPELGNFALILALGLALIQGVLPTVGAWRGNSNWIALARPAALGQCTMVVIAFGCLLTSFVVNDFSVANVAANSNSGLPLHYRIAATWGSHEGSLLLWTLMLALWTLAVAARSRQLPAIMVARVIGVMGLISIGFLLFMLLTSNPFARLLPAAIDGNDLNPLLQDFGMIVHPPLLYMGYVGFSVAFAFALSALIGGQLDAAWARWSRPWTTVAWMFLTLGIAMGSFWAYYELGWGGWWFWDPVENASFMPWLIGTALIHSLAVTEKRNAFKSWTVLLAIVAFSLSLLGTFLVRSGVLTSVHAFATDPARGIFILAFLAIVIGGSLLLFAWRAPKIGLGGSFALFSRESLLLVNNVLFAVAAGTVLLGTLYPLFLDALNLGKLSVGPPYFETVFVPLMLPALLLLAIAPFVSWKRAAWPEIWRQLRWISALTLVVMLAGAFALDTSPLMLLGLGSGAWIVLATAGHLVQRVRQMAPALSLRQKLRAQPRSYYGMLAAHIGIGLFVFGVTLAKGLEQGQDVSLRIGDSATIGGYVFRFDRLSNPAGPNYQAIAGHFSVMRDGQLLTTLAPEKRIYRVQKSPLTEAAIDYGLWRHLFVSLGEAVDASTWIVRIQVKPFISWIWLGCVCMAFGGLLAASDRRYRLGAKSRVTTNAAPSAPEVVIGAIS